jgi:hypothetical protein
MSLSGSKSRMQGLTREISVQWAETHAHWRDAKSEEFERRYITELSYQVNRSMQVVDQLEEILKKVRSDCE